jgi:hypothetical protein
MLVLITDSGVRVNQPHDFGSLALETRVPLDATIATLQTSGLASGVHDGHAWLSIATLKKTAAVEDDEWARRFDQMIDSVRPYGWVSKDGLQVRAHVKTI